MADTQIFYGSSSSEKQPELFSSKIACQARAFLRKSYDAATFNTNGRVVSNENKWLDSHIYSFTVVINNSYLLV